ncbi:hypothetical protein N9V13_05605 [Betaproteobacteria bacterium]|nr:hypothetical protein [Betaproteobacteria bacterium]
MDIHKKIEIQEALGKPNKKPSCRICKLIRVYLLFAIPTLALFWVGVDFGIGDIDAQDLVVKVVLLVLFFSIVRRIYLDFFRSDR